MDTQENKFKALAAFLDSLTPMEFGTFGVICAYILSYGLASSEQNSLGNWLELVGQYLLTVSAQANATPTEEEYNNLLEEVKNLRKEIELLKKKY